MKNKKNIKIGLLLILIIILIGIAVKCNGQINIANEYKDAALYNLSDSSELEIFYMAEEFMDTIKNEWINQDVTPAIGSITFKEGITVVSGEFNNWKNWEFQEVSKTQYAITKSTKQYQTLIVWPNNILGIFIISTGFLTSDNNIELPKNEIAFEAVIMNINKTRRFIFLGLIAN